MIGDGGGVWSFIHVDDAAAATALAIERAKPGIFDVVDDDPAEVSVWLPELARERGAKVPYKVPAWIGRLAVGDAGVFLMTKIRGLSNAEAKRVLGWTPIYPSWGEGFRAERFPSRKRYRGHGWRLQVRRTAARPAGSARITIDVIASASIILW